LERRRDIPFAFTIALSVLVFACGKQSALTSKQLTPSQVYRNFREAIRNKDVAAFKKAITQRSLRSFAESEAAPLADVDQIILSRLDIPQAPPVPPTERLQTRNERIEGERATLEAKYDDDKDWSIDFFLKEEGEWRLEVFLGNASPRLFLQTLDYASKKNEVMFFKALLGKRLLEEMERKVRAENRPVDEAINELRGTLARDLPDRRDTDPQIQVENESKATLKIEKIEMGQPVFVIYNFTKEDNGWKIDAPARQIEAVEQPGAVERETPVGPVLRKDSEPPPPPPPPPGSTGKRVRDHKLSP